MRTLAGAFALLSILGPGPGSVNFDAVKPGVAPPNWTFVTTQGGPRPRWEVRFDPSAPSRGNVLEPVSGSAGAASPVAVFDTVVCRDGDLSVKFKIERRGKGRTAGLVWRYQDPGNYYLLDFNADEKRVALFRVRNGVTAPVPVEGGQAGMASVYHDISTGEWYVAKVIFRGSKFRVLVGNRRLFDAVDSGIGGPGKTGLWAQGKTTASFDDFRIEKKG